jgi:hypothetical protein
LGGFDLKIGFFGSFYPYPELGLKKGIILCVEKEIITNRKENIYFREKNNLFSDKYFH